MRDGRRQHDGRQDDGRRQGLRTVLSVCWTPDGSNHTYDKEKVGLWMQCERVELHRKGLGRRRLLFALVVTFTVGMINQGCYVVLSCCLFD